MSCFKDGKYYALIRDFKGDRKILASFGTDISLNEIRQKAEKYEIRGMYVYSSEDQAIITDDGALKNALDKNNAIVVTSWEISLYGWKKFQ